MTEELPVVDGAERGKPEHRGQCEQHERRSLQLRLPTRLCEPIIRHVTGFEGYAPSPAETALRIELAAFRWR